MAANSTTSAAADDSVVELSFAGALSRAGDAHATPIRLKLWGTGPQPDRAAKLAQLFQTAITQLDLRDNEIGDAGALAIAESLTTNATITQLDLGSNEIGEVGASAIAESLKANTTITQLNLGGNQIGGRGASAIAELLKANTTITQLDLQDNKIGDVGASMIAESLKANATITKLDLGSNEIGEAGASVIAESLKTNATIAQVNLENNEIGEAGASALADSLNANTTITQLDLGSNEIGEAGALAIADLLKTNATITQLDLQYNRIGDTGASAIAESLKTNATVAQLHLEVNQIGDVGASAIAKSLETNTTVTQLHLQANDISEAGASAIAASLKTNVNTAITQLDLWSNHIGDAGASAIVESLTISCITATKLIFWSNQIGNAGASAIAESLKNNTGAAITQLDLQSNQIGPVGASAIADSLKTNTTITQLHLGGNQIGDAGASAIAASLETNGNTTITQLDLWSNQIGDSGASAIAETLKTNTTLNQLHLGGNKIGADGAAAIAAALMTNATVNQLDLGAGLFIFHANDIGDDGASAIAEALKTNNTLTQLNLQSNEIGDRGASAIAEALKTNTAITQLHLQGNQIGDNGASAIAASLKTNAAIAITQLILRRNQIGDDGAAALFAALLAIDHDHERPRSSPLRLLDLTYNNISHLPTNFHLLATHCPSLKILLANNNPVYPPPSLWPNGKSHPPTQLVAFFRDLTTSTTTTLSRSRIMLIGAGGAGKTTLATALKLRSSMANPEAEVTLAAFHAALKSNFAALSEDELCTWLVEDVLRNLPNATGRWVALRAATIAPEAKLTGKLFLAHDIADLLAPLDLPPRQQTLFTAIHTLLNAPTLSLDPSAPYAFLLHIPHLWTSGIDLSTLHPTPDTTLALFDFAGQMEFFPAHQLFLWSRQAIYTIVFDVRRGLSHSIARIQRWLDMLKLSRSRGHDPTPAVVVLVATHSDIEDERTPVWRDTDPDELINALTRTNGEWLCIVGCFHTRYAEPDGGDIDKLCETLVTLAAERDEQYEMPVSYLKAAEAIVAKSRELQLWPVVPASELPNNPTMLLALSDLAFLKKADESDTYVLDPIMWLSRILSALLHPQRGLMTILADDRRDLPTLTGRDALAIINGDIPSLTVASIHRADILPLLADFGLCLPLPDGVSFVVPAVLPQPTAADLERCSASPTSTIAARRFKLAPASDCRLLPPALEVALLRFTSDLVGAVPGARLDLLRSGLLAFSIDAHLRGLVWFHGEGELRMLDLTMVGSRDSGPRPQYLLDTLCSGLAKCLRRLELLSSVHLDKIALIPAALCTDVAPWRPRGPHPLLGHIAQMPVTTTPAPLMIRDGTWQQLLTTRFHANDIRLPAPSWRIERDTLQLLTDDRFVTEDWPGKIITTPSAALSLSPSNAPTPTPPTPASLERANTQLFRLCRTLALDEQQHIDLSIAFDDFWNRYSSTLVTCLATSPSLVAAFTENDVFTLSAPTHLLGGSTADGTAVLFADWDVLAIINGADPAHQLRPVSPNLYTPTTNRKLDSALCDALCKALKTTTRTLLHLTTTRDGIRILRHTPTTTTCTSLIHPLVEFDLVPVFAVRGDTFAKVVTLTLTDNKAAAQKFVKRAEFYHDLPELARALKLLLKRGLNLPLHDRHVIKVPSCAMTKVLMLVVDDPKLEAKWWNRRDAQLVEVTSTDEDTGETREELEEVAATTFQDLFNTCLVRFRKYVEEGEELPSSTTGDDTLWMYDGRSKAMLRHCVWRMREEAAEGHPLKYASASAMAIDLTPDLRAEMLQALSRVLDLNALELLELLQTARTNLVQAADASRAAAARERTREQARDRDRRNDVDGGNRLAAASSSSASSEASSRVSTPTASAAASRIPIATYRRQRRASSAGSTPTSTSTTPVSRIPTFRRQHQLPPTPGQSS